MVGACPRRSATVGGSGSVVVVINVKEETLPHAKFASGISDGVNLI